MGKKTVRLFHGLIPAVVLVGILVLLFLPSAVVADGVVTFPDANLEAVIREALGKPTGDILQSELLTLSTLDGSNRNIVDLSGMEYCVNLETLNLANNQITGVLPLYNAGLAPWHCRIYLEGNPINIARNLRYLYQMGGEGPGPVSYTLHTLQWWPFSMSLEPNETGYWLVSTQATTGTSFSAGWWSLFFPLPRAEEYSDHWVFQIQVGGWDPDAASDNFYGFPVLEEYSGGASYWDEHSPVGIRSLRTGEALISEGDYVALKVTNQSTDHKGTPCGLGLSGYLEGPDSDPVYPYPRPLTVNTSGEGSVTRNPNQATYGFGEWVTLTANPAAGRTFAGWSGDVSDLTANTNPITIRIDDNKVVTAIFNQPPNQPSNVSPALGATGVSLMPALQSSDFSDSDVGDTLSASQWQITSIPGDYSSPIFDGGSASVPSGVLDYSITYYWRVRHQDNHGVWSPWSVETSFMTMNRQPDQPANSEPGNGETGVNPTSTLTSSAFHDPDTGDTHAASQWQVTTVSGNYSLPVFDSSTDNTNLTELALSPGILNGHTAYFWHVRYMDNHALWSEWSAETSFTTSNRPPNQPVNTSPSNGAAGVSLTPTLECSAFSDPDGGDVHGGSQWQITTISGDYTSPVFDSGTGTQITLSSGILNRNTTYYWHVRYQDSHSAWSEWSAETSFATGSETAAPVISAVTAISVTGNSATISWTTDEVASGQVQYGLTTSYESTTTLDTNMVTSHSVNLSDLTPGSTYHYKVISADTWGNPAQSADYTFTTQTILPSVATTDATEIGTATATLNGNLTSLGSASSVQVSFEWGTTSGSYANNSVPQTLTVSGSFYLDLSGLSSSTTYYFRAKAVGDGTAYGLEMGLATFAPPNQPPSQPSNGSPANGATAVSRMSVLQSSSFSDPDVGDTHLASQWQVTSIAGDYSAAVYDSGTDAGHLTSTATSTLSYSTSYYWRVRHQDNHGTWSEWSTETSFTTAAQPQADFSISSTETSQGSIVVFFTNLSSGGVAPLTCEWDFDSDGTTDSTEWEPWHSYAQSGTHLVSLSVRDATGGSDVTVSSLTLISSSGATVETADGRVSTEFSTGAVSGAALVTMGTRSANGLPTVPKDFMIGDTCFVIMAVDENGNEIVTLSQPSTITVKYSEADLAAAGGNPNKLVLAYWDEPAGEWKPLETSVDTANMTLSASTTHLSTWAVMAKTTSASSGLPLWSWVLIGLAAVLVTGTGTYLVAKRVTAKK